MNEQIIDSNNDSNDPSRVEKLKYVSENIASLDDEALDAIAGGMEAGSTCANLTCSWCTSTMKSGGSAAE